MVRAKKGLGFSLIFTLLLLSLIGHSTCYYLCEGKANDQSILDALWLSIISITTIGYGDFYASTFWGRLSTLVFIIMIGMSAFTVFLGMMIDWTTNMILKGKYGMGSVIAQNHILIVNFPSEKRVRRMIEEIQSDPSRGRHEVVVISDTLESLPFEIPNVLFVHGSPLESETYYRANIEGADLAIVLAPSYGDPHSDAVVASAVAVIESIRPDIRSVAECLSENHCVLFKTAHCDSIIQGMKIIDHMLVQEVYDPGIAQMLDVITSNIRGATLFSTRVEDTKPGIRYSDIAKMLLDKDINFLCVNRGKTSHTSFQGFSPETDDRVIYIAATRLTWPQLLKEAQMTDE